MFVMVVRFFIYQTILQKIMIGVVDAVIGMGVIYLFVRHVEENPMKTQRLRHENYLDRMPYL